MRSNKNIPSLHKIEDPYFDEVKNKTGFSFDFLLWFYRLLKYWYLFLISVVFCWYIADLKNRSWVSAAQIKATLILEENGQVSPVSGAVPLGSLLRNTTNQQLLLRHQQMTKNAINNATFPEKMYVDYFVQTPYKTVSRYTDTPVEIEILELKDDAYRHIFNIAYISETQCRIYYDETESTPGYAIVAEYGKIIVDKRFSIKLKRTDYHTSHFAPLSFRFLSKNELIGRYVGKANCALRHPEGTMLDVTMNTSDPGKDIEYMLALLNAFQEYNLTLKNEQATQTVQFIDKQSVMVKDSLEQARDRLQSFQIEHNIYEVNSPDLRLKIKEVELLQDDLTIKVKALLAFSDKISQSITEGEELISPEIFEIQSATLQRDITEYNQIIQRSQNMAPKNMLYEKTIDRLTTLQSSILKELNLLLIKAEEERETLDEKYSTLNIEIRELPPIEREYLNLERIARINEVYDEFLRRRREEAIMQKNSNISDNRIFELPQIENQGYNHDEKNKRKMFYLMLGLFVPLAFIVVKEEFLNNTVSTKEECEKISGLPVIGTIENIAKKLKAGVVLVKHYPKSSFAESFRNMRVRIEYMAQRESKISVMVTSAEPGDGKTFIATNLASVYQLTGKKVIIVDLDLRRPSVSKTLNMETFKGVSNYLIGQITLEEAILTDTEFGFDIIPAGTLPPNPSELIKSAKTKELLDILKERYDYVIADCSPVGLVSDAYILSQMIDVPLFVVRRAKTNKAFFKSVVEQARNDMNNVALVFNDVKGREGYYGTSRYYGNRTYYLKKKSSYYHDDYFEN